MKQKMTIDELENSPGVLKVIDSKNYYTYKDVMELLGCSKSKAYDIIAKFREELIATGKIHPLYLPAKVPRSLFNKAFCITTERSTYVEKKKEKAG